MLKFFISRASKFNFTLFNLIRKNIPFSQCLLRKHRHPTRNNNLPKRSYPDVSNGKANMSSDYVNIMNTTKTEKSTVMSSSSKHSIPLNLTSECRVTYSEGEK